MNINAVLDKYQATGCEDAFGEIYQHIYGTSRGIIQMYSRKYRLDESDVESLINEKILLYARKFDRRKGEFEKAVNHAIKNGCIDLHRRSKFRMDNETEVTQEDEDGVEIEIYELREVAPTTSEVHIIEEMQKKHDQRQLTAFLLSKVNEPTLKSVFAFIKYETYRNASKHIGTSDKTIKAHIRNISKFFNCEKFGDINDYLTVPTKKAV